MSGAVSSPYGGAARLPTAAAAAPPMYTSSAARYERAELIGEGTYGKVRKAFDVRKQQWVAIKKSKVTAADQGIGGLGFTALREVKLMQAVKHPNVLSCLDVFSEDGALYIVMEYMDCDLKKIVEDPSVALNESHVKCLARQIFEGLKAIHDRFFVHRDITPGNVLVSRSTGVAVLCDFGFARTLGHKGPRGPGSCMREAQERPLTPKCTTIWYRAPEMLYGAKFYGQGVDIWSAGCILGELFLREPLFPGERDMDMLEKVFQKRGTPTESTWLDVSALPTFLEFTAHPQEPLATVLPTASVTAHSLVDRMLMLDPKQRPTAGMALEHEFFSGAPPLACRPHELPFVQARFEAAAARGA